jgi:hypothetical protein
MQGERNGIHVHMHTLPHRGIIGLIYCFCSCLLHPTQPFNQLPASSHQKARI